MKLWLLKQPNYDYDENAGFVIRAETETDARRQAAGYSADEGPQTWTDPDYSHCWHLSDDGTPGVILRDFRAG